MRNSIAELTELTTSQSQQNKESGDLNEELKLQVK